MRLREIITRTAGVVAFLFATNQACAQGITVPSGATLSLGNGQINLFCGDLVVEGQVFIDSGAATGIRDVEIMGGTLTGGSGTLSLARDWLNAGSFNAATGAVGLGDGCGASSSALIGDTDFFEFSTTSTSGKVLLIEAGSSQTFASSLSLEGDPADRLLIRSSVPGQQAFFSLDTGGSQTIWAVDVRDNNALGGQALAPGSPGVFSSVDSGNNDNWFIALVGIIFEDGFE
jgi:hypothetical protein